MVSTGYDYVNILTGKLLIHQSNLIKFNVIVKYIIHRLYRMEAFNFWYLSIMPINRIE